MLLGLWKLAGTHPEQPAMLKFLANNFDEERWKTAALKNAFALLGKQRYGNNPDDLHRILILCSRVCCCVLPARREIKGRSKCMCKATK